MLKGIAGFKSWMIVVIVFLAGGPTQAIAVQGGLGKPVSSPLVVAEGGPVWGGNGPGMGHYYQRQTPAPGRIGPENRGGYFSDPTNHARTPNPEPDSPYQRESVSPGQQSGRPRYGRGGRGYGYGYPGYRGQGGSGYPRHRQYGNPPRYPAAVAPGDRAVP